MIAIGFRGHRPLLHTTFQEIYFLRISECLWYKTIGMHDDKSKKDFLCASVSLW